MSSVNWTRRAILGASAAAGLGVAANVWEVLRQPKATVMGLRCPTYEEDLVGRIREGIRAFPRVMATVKGARVLLKPNLVEVHKDRPVNTDVRLIAAAVDAFYAEGAREVGVAEGPGHVRDSDALLYNSGLDQLLSERKVMYTDLNVDDWDEMPVPADFTGMGRIPVARSILSADLVVSMPKLKTHHWAGATLSMKNLFGTVPGVAVGWPKNRLHWAGLDASIVDLWSGIRPGFAIVDGIIGMEGDGPIMGSPVPHGLLLFGEHLPAVDATAARLMGLDPYKIKSLRMSASVGGTLAASRITQIGDVLEPRDYELVPLWTHLRA
jgi:uncharacterized protein (DUF362 family)